MDTHKKLLEISRHLSPWTPDKDERNPHIHRLVHPNPELAEAGIYVSPRNGRFHISGRYPRDAWIPQDSPSITVSAKRDAESIARDIQRRFLDAYTELFDELQAWTLDKRRRVADANEVLDELEEILETTATYRHDVKRFGLISSYRSNYGGLYVKASTHDKEAGVEVNLQLDRVPADVALEILRMIKAAEAEAMAELVASQA